MSNWREEIHQYFILALLLMWALGIHVSDLARVLALVTGSFLVFWKPSSPQLAFPLPATVAIRTWLSFYILMIPVYQIVRVHTLNHGIDFAIFSEVIANIAEKGTPISSFIAPFPKNFLGHHWTPFLYFPAALVHLGIPDIWVGPIVQALLLGVGFILFYKMCLLLDLDKNIALILTLLLAINPSIRHTVFWGIHDETFSFAFIALAFYGWARKSGIILTLGLLLCCTTKESLFVFAFLLPLTIILQQKYRRETNVLNSKFLLTLSALGFLAFVSYFLLQPLLIEKQFDHLSKVATLDQWLDLEILSGKALWIFFLFLPFLGFYFVWRKIFLILPALGFIGIVLVSGFGEMWKPFNYYAATPSFILFFSLVFMLKDSSEIKQIFTQRFCLFLVAISFSFVGEKPVSSVNKLRKEEFYSKSDFRLTGNLPEALTATASVLPLLIGQSKIHRIGFLPTNLRYTAFIHPSEASTVPPHLTDSTTPCGTVQQVMIRCSK